MPKVLRSREGAELERWAPKPILPVITVADSTVQAAEILAAARREAERLLADARREAVRIHQQATADGVAQGETAGRQTYAEACANLERLSSALVDEQEDFFNRMEPECVRLAVAIAEKVVDQQLTVQPDIVVGLARTALKRIREREAVAIRVHPEDLPMLAAEKPVFLQEIDGLQELQLVEDQRVGRGGVVVETPHGALDSRIASRLAVIKKGLEETQGTPDAITQL